MITLAIDNLDLKKIANSGQCFRMTERYRGEYQLIALDKYLEISETDKQNIFTLSCSELEYRNFWYSYFDMDTDYNSIISSVNPKDTYLNEAIKFGYGIRILKQDLWEIIVTFLISQNNNITRIRKTIDALCLKFGKPLLNFRGEIYYSFPSPKALADASNEELRYCGLGYRDKYINKTARLIDDGTISLETLCSLNYLDSHKKCMELPGVGSKVADCICLFGLHHTQAFPLDTHIKAILAQHYPEGFPHHLYEGYQGILQQYMFYYDL